MNLKALDQIFGEILAAQLAPRNFKARGRCGARDWYRQVTPGIRQLICTPCVPARLGGGFVSCGVGVRFDDIEEELARLTDGTNCLQPSLRSATVGATLGSLTRGTDLHDLRGAEVEPFRFHLSDAASVGMAVDQLVPLLNEFAMPWLERMDDYEAAYREYCADLARFPIRHTIDVVRTYLLARKLGFRLDESALRHLRRIVDADDIGADVCLRILELNGTASESNWNCA